MEVICTTSGLLQSILLVLCTISITTWFNVTGYGCFECLLYTALFQFDNLETLSNVPPHSLVADIVLRPAYLHNDKHND